PPSLQSAITSTCGLALIIRRKSSGVWLEISPTIKAIFGACSEIENTPNVSAADAGGAREAMTKATLNASVFSHSPLPGTAVVEPVENALYSTAVKLALVGRVTTMSALHAD